MKAFSERNPITIGVLGLASLIAIGTATYYADDLPVIGGGTEYSAYFGDAAGLRPGGDVRVAGVKVGTIDSISLQNKQVRVVFKIKDAWLGDRTTASIGIKTMLGQEYIALEPQGERAQDPDAAIPLNRTTTPMDVTAAFSGLSKTIDAVDTKQLATAFDTLAAAFADTPSSVKSALTGLRRLSTTIASRDTQLLALADQAQLLTSTLARSNDRFTALIKDGGILLRELQARSAAITALLEGTRDLSRELAGFVHDNENTLGPALRELGRVADILIRNRGNLSQALKLLGPYYSMLNDTVGSGPWLDIYICGLFDAKTNPVLEAKAVRNCHPKRGTP